MIVACVVLIASLLSGVAVYGHPTCPSRAMRVVLDTNVLEKYRYVAAASVRSSLVSRSARCLDQGLRQAH